MQSLCLDHLNSTFQFAVTELPPNAMKCKSNHLFHRAPILLAPRNCSGASHSLSRAPRLSIKRKQRLCYRLNRLPLFCGRFISHNPLDCDHATTYTLKHVVIEIMKLKSFDGHKIKCLNLEGSSYEMAGK